MFSDRLPPPGLELYTSNSQKFSCICFLGVGIKGTALCLANFLCEAEGMCLLFLREESWEHGPLPAHTYSWFTAFPQAAHAGVGFTHLLQGRTPAPDCFGGQRSGLPWLEERGSSLSIWLPLCERPKLTRELGSSPSSPPFSSGSRNRCLEAVSPTCWHGVGTG